MEQSDEESSMSTSWNDEEEVEEVEEDEETVETEREADDLSE